MWAMATDPQTTAAVPRGRHAPPLEVRLSTQRRRLFAAAAAVFARHGYAEASAEAVAKEAGMSKATFYEHFANKEECLLALFDQAAADVAQATIEASEVAQAEDVDTYEEWVRRRLRAFLERLQANPEVSQTLLVEVVAAGPRARARRDEVLDLFAETLYADNAANAPRLGAPTFASKDDAFAVVGAIAEVAARSVRRGDPDVDAIEPTLRRLILGVVGQR